MQNKEPEEVGAQACPPRGRDLEAAATGSLPHANSSIEVGHHPMQNLQFWNAPVQITLWAAVLEEVMIYWEV